MCKVLPRSLFLIILFISGIAPVSGQLQTYDLDPALAGNFNSESEIYSRGTALNLGHHPHFGFNTTRRLRLGISLTRAVAVKSAPFATEEFGLIPVLEAGYLLSSNLLLTGKMSGHTSGGDQVQILSYGGSLLLGRSDQEKRARMDLNFAALRGPDDIDLRQTDILFQRQYNLLIPLQLGVGVNLFTSDVDLTGISRKWEGQTNYFYLGGLVNTKYFNLGWHSRWHPHLFTFAVDISGEFF